MHDIDLASFDLNLLFVLDVLLQEQHVTRAARRLGRTQSATSHALARLREQLDDPLLVRVGGEMRPTPRATQLAPELRRLLRAIEHTLATEAEWDPSTTERTFTIVGPDFMSAVLPMLAARFAERAPHADLELVAPSHTVFRDVAEGRYDLAVAPVGQRVEGLIEAPVAALPWVVFARAEHPATAAWDLDAWLAYPHLRIRTFSPRLGPVDAALAELGRDRTMGMALPHFTLAASMLARTDHLLTVPRGALADLAERYGLRQLPCPIDLPPVELVVYRSATLGTDLAIGWLEEQLRAAVAEVW